MNTPIKPELAKLLIEKGIKIKSHKKYYFDKAGEEVTDEFIAEKYNYKIPSDMNAAKSVWSDSFIDAPIISDVVMWLYDKHKIWTEVHGWTNQPVGDEIWENCFQGFVNGDAMNALIFKTPTEAYEAAIKHCLSKLI